MNYKFLLLLLFHPFLYSQNINGTFPLLKNTEIILTGYEGFTTKELNKTHTDNMGHFSFSYPKDYRGAALIHIKNASNLVVLLNNEDLDIMSSISNDLNTIEIKNSKENEYLESALILYQKTQQKLSGLRYLFPLYENNSSQKKWVSKEIKLLETSFEDYRNSLAKTSLAFSYLKIRKLLSDMQMTKEHYKDKNRLYEHKEDFKHINLFDDTIWNSGLIKETITNFYQLLQNFESPNEAIVSINQFNDTWLQNKTIKTNRQQELANFCFTLLEQMNLTQASEHIALKMLNQENCQLSEKNLNLFEQYRKLAINKIAPDVLLNIDSHQTLKNLKNKYKLVVFGASTCPKCQNDYPSLMGEYRKLKQQFDIEFVYISIDTDLGAFKEYYKEAPFITFCDGKGWDTTAAKDFCIFSTPSYYLLNNELKIISKPTDPRQIVEILSNMN